MAFTVPAPNQARYRAEVANLTRFCRAFVSADSSVGRVDADTSTGATMSHKTAPLRVSLTRKRSAFELIKPGSMKAKTSAGKAARN